VLFTQTRRAEVSGSKHKRGDLRVRVRIGEYIYCTAVHPTECDNVNVHNALGLGWISEEKKLPRNPAKETAGVFAHDKLARLVEAGKEHPIGIGEVERVDCQTYTRSARAKVIGMKKCFAGILLVWKTLWLKEAKSISTRIGIVDGCGRERGTYKTGT
jgi:hypothetical protein